jgi:hypothetical protein
MIEDRLFIKTVLRIKTVIGRPILLMTVLRAQERTDGMTAKARQLRQKMAAGALKMWCAGKDGSAGADEFL